jgi:adenosylcobinamide-GDP ribazoletransferase
MTTLSTWARRIAADLKISIAFCTRLPVRDPAPAGTDVARASWALPIAGAAVGVIAALVYFIASAVRLSPPLAAALALAASTAVTGALHEDGLADTADGFGGGKDRESKLAIMRDSALGTYGACALILSFLLRWSALAAIAHPVAAAMALITAHASARAPLPIFMRLVPQARSDGLSAAAGEPPGESAAAACMIGVIALLVALGPLGGAIGVALLIGASLLMGRLSRKQIGGQTGDVIGALEQINEIIIMLIAAMVLIGR